MSAATIRLASGRSLMLAGHSAARAFSRRRAMWSPRRQRSAWNPVLLRWPRAKARSAGASARLHPFVVSAEWSAHFHLHFRVGGEVGVADALVAAQARSAARGLGFSVRAQDRRVVSASARRSVEPPRFYARQTFRTLNEIRTVRAQLRFRSKEQPRFEVSFASLARTFVQQAPQPRRVMQVSRKAFRVALGHSVFPIERARLDAPYAPIARFSMWRPAQPRIREQSSAGFFAPWRGTPQPRSPREFASAESSALAVPHSRPSPSIAAGVRSPELVWRARAGRPSEAVDFSNAEARPALVTSIARSAPERAATPVVQYSSTDKAIVRATALDPALVDRLAEDVIRRVERHVRIERERRGM